MQTTSVSDVNNKRSSVEAVLNSRSFDRCDQLKRFLRYVCEEELSGRAQDLTEYKIGVEALGRPENFSPSEDSIVRNRAYAVRKKLKEFYDHEAPEALLRIELPKGNYAPKFVTMPTEDPSVSVLEPAPSISFLPSAIEVSARPRRIAHRGVALAACGLLLGVLLSSGVFWWWSQAHLRAEPEPILRSAWGTMLQSGQTVLASVATPPQSFIREFPPGGTTVPGYISVDPQLDAWYHRQRPDKSLMTLRQVPTFNSPLWGDAAGAFRIATLLSSFGANCELQAERLVTSPVFRNRNVAFFGNPEYSPTITRLLRGMPLIPAYDAPTQDHGVFEYDSQGTVLRRFLPTRNEGVAVLKDVYGLITVLPGEGDGERQTRYVIFSGISSAGVQAAAEFFASPVHLKTLAQKMGVAPGKPWPSKYQVLIRTSTDHTIALTFEYELHRVVK